MGAANDFRSRFVELIPQQPCLGCSNEEIAALESEAAVTFPKSFRDYLTLLGHTTGLTGDYSFTYSEAKTATRMLRQLMMHKVILDAGIIGPVVACGLRLGEFVVFFDLAAGDDDPVPMMIGPERQVVTLGRRFSEFVVETATYYRSPNAVGWTEQESTERQK